MQLEPIEFAVISNLMADFVVKVLKWLVALMVAYAVLFGGLFVMILAFAFAFQEEVPQVKGDSVLVLDLTRSFRDSSGSVDPYDVLIQEFSASAPVTDSLRKIRQVLDKASDDDRIAGLLLVGNPITEGFGSSYANLSELRGAIGRFKDSGKPVWARIEGDWMRSYYVKSMADHISMEPFTAIDLKGVGAEILYLGEALESLGIRYYVLNTGVYKTALEHLDEGEMSEPNREQIAVYLDDLWRVFKEEVKRSRGIETEHLQAVADSLAIVHDEAALEHGLVDMLEYQDEFNERLTKVVGFDESEGSFRQISVDDYIVATEDPFASFAQMGGNEVAVVYAEGVIMAGEGGFADIGGARFARIIRDLRRDNDVKAVVLRVNSPGGSVTGSAQFYRELDLLRNTKPLIVSMGGYAASGGYWISCPADYIFAHPTTGTGSIGVIMGFPNAAGFSERFKLNWEQIGTAKHANLYSIGKEKSAEELDRLEDWVEMSYTEFKSRVSQGRDMELAEVEEIAQGRIWSGEDAFGLGLVDRLGGLDDAIAYAADSAGLGSNFRVTEYPKAVTLEDALEELFGGAAASQAARESMKGLMGHQMNRFAEQVEHFLQLNDPRWLYALSPNLMVVE